MSNTVLKTQIKSLQNLLRITFGLVPIVAGADKFTNLLVDWKEYLNPYLANLVQASTFMIIVGIIEIVAGILVLTKPKLGAYIVSAWLVGIALNLILTGNYFDVAVRDLVMAIAAYVLARLSSLELNPESNM